LPKNGAHTLLCAITGEALVQEEALKLVLSPDNVVLPDIEGSLPGDVCWVAFSDAVLKKLHQPDVVQSLFTKNAVLLPEFDKQLQRMLKRQLVQWLALSRKAGRLCCGSQKVRKALEEGAVMLVFQAKDGSERELKKLLQGLGKTTSVCNLFSGEELAGIFGRDHIGYLALEKAGLSEKTIQRCSQLAMVSLQIEQ
jgi:ribosomal protein L7Ae-like RNA K-turn-binding protein